MWFVTAVGSVNGQKHFSFALEQKRAYVVGRDKNADIRFDARQVRPREGELLVGDWNPADFRTPPSLLWRAEAKKNGAFPPLKTMSQRSGVPGTMERDDYDVDEREGGTDLDLEDGRGIEIAAGVWFSVQWRSLRVAYDGLKHEPEEFKDKLRASCWCLILANQLMAGVSWTLKTDADTDVVVSEELSSATNPSLAVCFGVPIVTPAWLQALQIRLRVCWKKNADSQDSFEMPDVDNDDFRPRMKEGLQAHRADPAAWRCDSANRTLFSHFCVVGLKTKKLLREQEYVVAMGAVYKEIDILSRPLLSAQDFLDRLKPIMASAHAEEREVLVVYYPSARKELADNNISFESVIEAPCINERIYTAGFGPVVWGAVRYGGVDEYFQHSVNKAQASEWALADGKLITASSVPPQSSAPEPSSRPVSPPPEPAPAPQKSSSRLIRRAGSRAASSRSASRAPSVPPASVQPDVVPSTFPDGETGAGKAAAPQPPPAPESAPEPEPAPAPPATSTFKKPLRRRAGRAKVDIDDDLDMDLDQGTQPGTQLHASHVPETQYGSGSDLQFESRAEESMDMDTQNTAAPNTRSARSKLKRRAGVGATQSSFLDGFHTTVQYEEEIKKQEKEREIRQLYEESKRETMSMASFPNKRARTEPRADSASREQLMDIDEEEDVVTRNLRQARTKREPISPAKRVPSPAKGPEALREPTPEVEEPVEEPPAPATYVRGTKASRKATQRDAAAAEVTRDEAFLQAIKTSRSKAMDDLDKEFNELRLPKPAKDREAMRRWQADYAIVRDFDDDPRGNFIEIVRKDLFRKDPPRVAVQVADDGRPNFKKFKKKNVTRRQPMSLVLAVSTDAAEMGERGYPSQTDPLTPAYWNADNMGTQRKSQQTPTQSKSLTQRQALQEEEDEAPLLPRSKRRLLSQIEEEGGAEDDFEMMPSTAKRRGMTPLTQSLSQSQPDSRPTRRRTRAGSAVSEASSGGTSAAAPPPASKPPARARRGTQASRPVVVDDSDDDEPVFATARSTARTRATRGTAPATATIPPTARSSTLDFEDEAPRSTRATAGSSRATGRRKLLVEDDDDIAFQGVSKKRRLG